jgi:hypothetical protein
VRQAWAVVDVRQAAAVQAYLRAGVLCDYQVNKHVIHRVFCRTCGVESFARGVGKDGGEMFAINVRCLDGVDIARLSPKPFDGRSL